MRMHHHFSSRLLATTVLTAALGISSQASAAAAAAASEGAGVLTEVVVTAQKREQSLQDVPIAVTAISQETLRANRIVSIADLSSAAPGLVVRLSLGGISVPVVNIRGQLSSNSVTGADKQVSFYIDGVYISAPRGAIFELPDIERLEVLRGPQGTLFGRNATAGAISIVTREPSGNQHVRLEGTVGNLDAHRLRATVETPELGPFSAYFTVVDSYRRGDIANQGAGAVWKDLDGRTSVSPKWLGTVDNTSYFAAIKFQPSDNLKVVYKYDRNVDHGTPDGTGVVAYNSTGFGPNGALTSGGSTAEFLTALINSQPNPVLAQVGKRPASVNNAFSIPRDQTVQGHSLTATWQASDNFTVKNIFAYRQMDDYSHDTFAGLDAVFTQAAVLPYARLRAGVAPFATATAAQQATINLLVPVLNTRVGWHFLGGDSEALAHAKQWSDEVQANYTSDRLTATAGAVWFHAKESAGGPNGMAASFIQALTPPDGTLPAGKQGLAMVKMTSLAAYAQLEFKITPEVTVVGGARITHDKKDASFQYDTRTDPALSPGSFGPVAPAIAIVAPTYKNTKPSWLVGLNWKPNTDTLVYGKFSTSFVSGGTVAGVNFEPETAVSEELGAKLDLLDHRLRTNLALFNVNYNHYQSQQAPVSAASVASVLPILQGLYGPTVGSALLGSLGVFILDQGKSHVQGFELEVTAAPTRGLEVGGSLGYSHITYPYVTPVVLAGLVPAAGVPGTLRVAQRPAWTANLYASYETEPVFGDATLQFRGDMAYRGKILQFLNPALSLYPDGSNAPLSDAPAFATFNARIALKHLKFGGVDGELAIWGRNLTDRADPGYANTTTVNATTFLTARTFGLDLNLDF
jgi:iron complex outermembrane receptor protein